MVDSQVAWLKEEVRNIQNTKASKEFVEASIAALKDTSDRIRSAALEAKELARIHECKQIDKIDSLNKNIDHVIITLDRWKTVKFGVVVSAFVLLISGAAQWFALNSSVTNTKESVETIDKTVNSLAESVRKIEISNTEINLKYNSLEKNNQQLQEIKGLLKETILQINKKH